MDIDGFLEALGRLAEMLQPFDDLIRIVSFLMGFCMIAGSLYALRNREDRGGGAVPFVGLAVGALLLCFPSAVDILTYSMFGKSAGSLSESVESVDSGIMTGAVRFAVAVVMLVGYVQMVKGVAMLKNGARESGRFWIAVTHIVGGCLCVNVRSFMLLLASSVGGPFDKLARFVLGD